MAIIINFPQAARLKLADLVDISGFAEICGVQPLTIHAYRKKAEFGVPEPVAHVGNVPVWERRQAYQWMAQRPGQGARRDLADAG